MNFNILVDRRHTYTKKWDNIPETFGVSAEGILPFWIADMDFKTAEPIQNALVEECKFGVFGYPDKLKRCRQALTHWLYGHHDWDISNYGVSFFPRIMGGIAIAIECFTERGDKIVIQPPIYPPFKKMIEMAGRQVVTNPLVIRDGQYQINLIDLEKKFSEGVRCLLFCSPHNPTGRVWSKTELASVVDLCEKYNVILFCDEIHHDIVYDGHKHSVIAKMSDYISSHSVTFVAPTKTFNLAGMMASAAVIPNKEMAKVFAQAIERFDVQINQLGQTAFYTAYEKGEAWLQELLTYLAANRDLMLSSFAGSDISFLTPDGTYMYWLDFHKTGLSHDEILERLLSNAKVALYDGKSFGEEGVCFFRLNAACPRSILQQGLNRILQAF